MCGGTCAADADGDGICDATDPAMQMDALNTLDPEDKAAIKAEEPLQELNSEAAPMKAAMKTAMDHESQEGYENHDGSYIAEGLIFGIFIDQQALK